MKKSFLIILSILLLFAYENAYAVNGKNCQESLGKQHCVLESGLTYTGYVDSQCRWTSWGELVWTGGQVYTGEWLLGEYHGKGSYTFTDGTRFKGRWNMGVIVSGTYYGKGFERTGKFKDGEEQGVHIYENTTGEHNGRKVEQIWKDGELIKEGKVLRTAEEARRQWQEAARLEKKQEEEAKVRNTIYNNCLLDKSKDVDMDVRQIREAVEDTCWDIAGNPSYWESFKYK